MELIPILRKYAIIDWILALCVWIVGISIEYSSFPDNFVPYINSDISNPIKTSTIPYSLLCIFMYGVGTCIVLAIWLVYRRDVSVLKVLASYIFAINFTILLCSVFKRIVGRPRPDTLTLCGGDGSYKQCSTVLSAETLMNQFRSFPSGHAAESMASSVFITLLLSEIWSSGSMFSAMMKMIPVIWSIFVGISRIWDHAHHIDDVVAGYLLGLMVGCFTFKSLKVGIALEQKKTANPTDASASQFSAYV